MERLRFSMFNIFFPDEFFSSTYKINFNRYYESGYRGIIFDIDNTLVPHGAPADERSIQLIDQLKKMGFQVLFLSNNKEPRVQSFCGAVQCKYLFKANKPAKSGYLKAMDVMHTNNRNTLFVGDQLFTDVWGAKRTGIHAILVQQIEKKEEIQIVLKRYLEKIVLAAYRQRCRKEGKAWIQN